MKADKILQSSLLDILFENKNKAYGAYELRTNYAKRMRKAIATGLFLVTLVFVGLTSFTKKGKEILANITGTTGETTLHEPPKDKVEPEKPKEKPKQGIQAAQAPKNPNYTEPDFDDNKNIRTNNLNLDNNPNGNPFLFNGDSDEPIGDGPSGDVLGGGGKDTTTVKLPKIEPFPIPEALKPSYKASYIGGWDAFANYLQDKLSDEAIEDNMDKKITMSFWIETDGSITNVTAEGNDDAQFVQKAIKVFQKMKKWQPAMEKGELVRTFKVIPVTIVLPQD
jgi:periplasmic protein TonB